MHPRSLLLLATAAALACSGSSTGPVTGGGGADVTVKNDFYSPATFTVQQGGTVTWVWQSSGVGHSVTFDTGTVSSGIQASGSFSHTFPAVGTVHYHCLVHGMAMAGTIVVSATSPGTQPDPGTPPPVTPYP